MSSGWTYALGLILSLVGLAETQQRVSAQQQPVTLVKGTPQFKISEGGVERVPEALSRQVAANLAVVASKIGDDYYWASRDNTLLVEVGGEGAYVTYIAANGSGYVRFRGRDEWAMGNETI